MILMRKILLLTYFHMCSRYRKAWAGFLWVVANPILTFVIQSLIFKSILKIEVQNYPAFLVSGLLPWFFISQSLYVVTNSLVASRDILLGFKIHPFVIVSSQVLDQFVSFLAAFLLISFFTVKLQTDFLLMRMLLVLISTFLICSFTILFTNLLAYWHVFYRDIQFITQFIMNLAFYVTPIFYQPSSLGNYQWLLSFNIFYPFISLYQSSLYQLDLRSWGQAALVSSVISLATMVMLDLSYRFKMKEFYIHV